MNNKKIVLIEMLTILKKYSDENHPLSIKEMVELEKSEYGRVVCRQSVSNNIKTLIEMGIDVEKVKSKYYYNNRDFEKEEIELLCHSVMASNAIPLNYSKQLIDRLKDTQSIYFGNNKNLEFNIYNIDKRDNKELFISIETISEAIDEGKYVEFEYQKYNINKELVTLDKKYCVIPCRTVSMQNRFYLVSYIEKYNSYVHFRMDKMVNVKKGKTCEVRYDIEPYEYTKNRLYMYSGDIKEFEIEFDEMIIDEVIDLFGKDIEIKKHQYKYRTKVNTTETAIKYFAYQFLDHAIVVEPKEYRDMIKDNLDKALNKYADNLKKERNL